MPIPQGGKLNPEDALKFIFAGKAILTVINTENGHRYTYQVKVDDKDSNGRPPLFFIKLLTGPDNISDYTYLGIVTGTSVKAGSPIFKLTKASTMKLDSKPIIAFRYLLWCIGRTKFPEALEVWHEGKCGRCGRKLTVPSSLLSGLGPECQKKGSFADALAVSSLS